MKEFIEFFIDLEIIEMTLLHSKSLDTLKLIWNFYLENTKFIEKRQMFITKSIVGHPRCMYVLLEFAKTFLFYYL